jgi:ATPase family associated with various cellular activities (AAA)
VTTARASNDVKRPGFEELRDLQDFLEGLLASSVPSMLTYYDEAGGGFFHREKKDIPGWSKASTATCVAFLEEAGLWNLRTGAPRKEPPWSGSHQVLSDDIVEGERYDAWDPLRKEKVTAEHAWESAELGVDNPFTVSFLLSALDHLRELGAILNPDQAKRVRAKAAILLTHLDHPGASESGDPSGVRIFPFPATAFLTYKAVKALDAASRLLNDEEIIPNTARQRANNWGWQAMRAEIVALAAKQIDADPFELAYALLLVVRTVDFVDMRPADRGILRHALDVFFLHQTEHGVWPRSRPLFMYPKVGNAYCYDYELLTEMLGEPQLREMLLDKLPDLATAARAVDRTKYPRGTGYGWASGHHRQDPSAESWSTASVYHYLWSLQRLAAEAIRVEVFRYAGVSYRPLNTAAPHAGLDTSNFADSEFSDNQGDKQSLVQIIDNRFLMPIAADNARTSRGLPLQEDTPCSAILYGPPGTSKTNLASLIADALGWPLLALDPSHLTRNGLDRLHEESNRIFGMLAATERLVVLLDEFDELVRERGSEGSEFVSRFLTTSMLPKIQALANRRRIVWLVTTNHIEIFDSAIRRPGRFDMIVPLLPPTAQEKLERFTGANSLTGKRIALGDVAMNRLAALTWGECEKLDHQLKAARTKVAAEKAITAAWEICTMRTPIEDRAATAARRSKAETATVAHKSKAETATGAELWEDSIKKARSLIRLP